MFYHNREESATPAQRQCLESMGVRLDSWLSASAADRLIKENQEKWAQLPPTERQRQFLQYRGRWREGMNRAEATDLIGRIKDGRDELDRLLPPWMRDELDRVLPPWMRDEGPVGGPGAN